MKTGCESRDTVPRRSIQLPVLNTSPAEQKQIPHSRMGRWRAAALIALTLLMIAHVIQWKLSGTTISPIEPSEAMYTIQNGAVNAGFIFFSIAILATLILGRFVCGWACHIVALQDLCAWLMKKVGLTPRPFRSRLLVYVPVLVAFYMFVWPTVYRAVAAPRNEPLIPQFTNHLITTNFWETFPSVAVAIPFLFICGFMTVYFLGSKGFCTYACPYGGVFGLADKVAPGRIRVTDACNQCGHCTAVCTSNVIVHAEVAQYGMVVDPGCMKCMDCISACPNDALYFGFGKPAVGVTKTLSRTFSLTWPEEIFAAIVFAISFFAFWDVYQLVPMLMALGAASVTTFLAVRVLKLFRSKDQSFHRFILKAGGVITRAGWIFLTLSLLALALTAHSGWIRYHERAGNIAFQSVTIPDELALAKTNPAQWLSGPEREHVAAGRRHLETAISGGLFMNSEAMPKLAWLEYLSGNTEKAVGLLEAGARHQGSQGKAISFYYRGAILNRLGRFDEALVSLDQAIAERPDLVLASEERGVALWHLGRRPEAVATWADCLRRNSSLAVSANFLAGAAALQGDTATAAEYERQAQQITPADGHFQWMLAMRLQNVGMHALAEKHFQRAIQLRPELRLRRTLEALREK